MLKALMLSDPISAAGTLDLHMWFLGNPQDPTAKITRDRLVREVTYGIFRTPDEFVKEAMKVRHPFDAPSALDDSNIQAMANILSSGSKLLRSFEGNGLNTTG